MAKEKAEYLLFFPSHASHLLLPLNVLYFHMLKQNIADLSAALGYMGCETLPRNLFPTLLHHYNEYNFWIFRFGFFRGHWDSPVNARSVKALVPNNDNSLPTNASNTLVNIDVEVYLNCGSMTVNPIVKLGFEYSNNDVGQ